MFARFFRDRRGNIAILSAVMITSLVGVSGLVAELGNGLLNRMQDQRIADVAAMGGGTVYNSTSSVSAMNAAVNNIATLNGITTAQISASLVNSPSGDGNQAVEVTVNSTVPLFLSRMVWSQSTLPVSASSYAEIGGGTPGCIMALSQSGSGVTLSGGTSITAAQCSVASNTSVTVPCGTYITTKAVQYDTTLSQGCNGIQPPTGGSLTITKALATDPLAGSSEVTGATSRLSTVAAITSPAAPSGPSVSGGTAISFGYSKTTTQNELTADGCSGTYASNTWTVTCVGSSSYHFGGISMSGGISVNFNTSGSYLNTYDFSGPISNTGSSLTFGPGTYNIKSGICTGGGTTTSFGSSSYSSAYNIGASSTCGSGSCPQTNFSICNTGTSLTFLGTSTFNLAGGVYNGGGATLTMSASSFSAGALTSSCGNTTGYSICQTGSTFTINGPTNFTLAGGIYNGGGYTLLLGSGSTNSFKVGTAATGDSVYMGGGAITTFADATGTGDVYQTAGNINQGGGGSCLTVSAASEHDINGALLMAGGASLGAGIYTFTDTVQMGANGGGAVTCNGNTIGLYGNDVTLVIGGGSAPTSGTCAGYSFCAAAGYSDITLVAPSSGNTEGLVVVGPTTSSNTNGALLTAGASGASISGAFYFPYGTISLGGGASMGNGAGQCLMAIGAQVNLTGGSAVASTCNIPGSSSGTTGNIALVQ